MNQCFDSKPKRRPRARRLKEAVLASFREHGRRSGSALRRLRRERLAKDPLLAGYQRPRALSARSAHRAWPGTMPARVHPESLPARISRRIASGPRRFFEEAAAISRAMSRQRISFALLKGITLTPESVPDCALRWQIDLDFLVAARDATAARHVLMGFGYGLHAVCGNTMEFTAGESSAPDIRKIYRVHSQRSLELHMLSTTPGRNGARTDRLARTQLRELRRSGHSSTVARRHSGAAGPASLQASLRGAHPRLVGA